MLMRITWGRIAPGRWEEFEAVFKGSVVNHNVPKGLKNRWLVRDQKDPDVGYIVTLWESAAVLESYIKTGQREGTLALLKPFFINQFTVTDCDVRSAEAI